jgi:hypothetical protein
VTETLNHKLNPIDNLTACNDQADVARLKSAQQMMFCSASELGTDKMKRNYCQSKKYFITVQCVPYEQIDANDILMLI